jgi:hypothetical protein
MRNYTLQMNTVSSAPPWTVDTSQLDDEMALKYAASIVQTFMPGVRFFMSLTVWANEGTEDFPESRFVGTISLNMPTTRCDRETP